MKKLILVLVAITCLAVSNLLAADAKYYRVTGPVLEINPTYIVIQRGEAKLQVVCDKATLGDIKAGDYVMIQYQMVAKTVDIKTEERK